MSIVGNAFIDGSGDTPRIASYTLLDGREKARGKA
jgi:hypothetical protein